MIMYENGVTVEVLIWRLKRYKGREVIVYYEFETPDDAEFDTDASIHTITGIANDGDQIRLLSEADDGKRITTDELKKRLSAFKKEMPVTLVNGEQITGVGIGSDNAGLFCFFIENNVLY